MGFPRILRSSLNKIYITSSGVDFDPESESHVVQDHVALNEELSFGWGLGWSEETPKRILRYLDEGEFPNWVTLGASSPTYFLSQS